MVLKRTVESKAQCCRHLLGAGVLGDSLGSLRHGVLGELTGEEETDGGLDFPGGDGGPPVVVGKTAGLGGNTLEDVVREGGHDGHSLGADTSVRVHLLQHLVDVDGVGFPPPPPLLLVSGTLYLGLGGGLLGSLGCSFGWHDRMQRVEWWQSPSEPLYTSGRAVCAARSALVCLQKRPAPQYISLNAGILDIVQYASATYTSKSCLVVVKEERQRARASPGPAGPVFSSPSDVSTVF